MPTHPENGLPDLNVALTSQLEIPKFFFCQLVHSMLVFSPAISQDFGVGCPRDNNSKSLLLLLSMDRVTIARLLGGRSLL